MSAPTTPGPPSSPEPRASAPRRSASPRTGTGWRFSTSTRGCADTVAAITDAGGQAIGVGVDVADADQVAAAVAQVAEARAPRPSSSTTPGSPATTLFKMTEQDWDAVIGVHLRGSFLMTRAVQGHMTQERFGRIVNLLDLGPGQPWAGQLLGGEGRPAGFTKTLAIELGRFGVTANAVAPGFIQTDMTRATAERLGVSFETSSPTAPRRSRFSGSASRRTSPRRSPSSPATRPGSSAAR